MPLRELGDGGVGCDGSVSLWTVLICLGVTVAGLTIIGVFLACRWRRKRRRRGPGSGHDKTTGIWDDVWRPDTHIAATTHLPPPPTNGDSTRYQLTTPSSRLGPPPRLPPDHPLHLLHHHQACLQQCPYAALHPVYQPLLHPDHNSTFTSLEDTPTYYGDGGPGLPPTSGPTITSLGPPPPLTEPPNWYATIGGDGGGEDSGRESRPLTPLELTGSPRKVPVTYV